MAGKGRAGPRPAQEVAEGEDCPVPPGGAGEVGDGAVPPNMHTSIPRLPGQRVRKRLCKYAMFMRRSLVP